jgi:hypothetical protein
VELEDVAIEARDIPELNFHQHSVLLEVPAQASVDGLALLIDQDVRLTTPAKAYQARIDAYVHGRLIHR